MTSTAAPGPWPRSPEPGALWGAPVHLEASATEGLRWVLRRNCSLAPRQVLVAYLALCAVSLVIALGFAWAGATPVLWFAGLELAIVGVALLVYARHAADHETITLKNSTVSVEHHCGSRVERAELRADWLRVEPLAAQGSLLTLTAAGRRVRVGRYLRPEWRNLLAQDLRRALRSHAESAPAPAADEPPGY